LPITLPGTQDLLLLIPLGLFIGVGAGVAGYSAWPLLVPLLFVVRGEAIDQAILASMLVDVGTAATLCALYRRSGNVDLRVASRLAPLAAAAAIPGCVFSLLYLDQLGGLLKSVSGVITVVIGALFVRRGLAAGSLPQPARGAGSEHLLHAGVGGVGLLMGLIGMGGGFSIAALLVFVRGTAAARSVGTALFVTALVLSVVSLAYLFSLHFRVSAGGVIVPVLAASMVGALLGATYAQRIGERRLNLSIGVVVIIAGTAATIQMLGLR